MSKQPYDWSGLATGIVSGAVGRVAGASTRVTGTPPNPPPPSRDRLEALCRALLIELGEDPDREGLIDTPRRWARWWMDFVGYEPGTLDTTFESVSHDQLVLVSGMRVWSLCEHHLLPFWCDVTVAYIAAGEVLGLSKFARIAHQAAHRLQLQEQLIRQIADTVEHITGSADVAVLGTGEHLCMTMRGIRTPARMTSSILRGQFQSDPDRRAELFALLRQ